MSWPIVRYKTAAAAGTWTPTDMNAVQDQLINASGIHLDGRLNIATPESTSSTSYGLLTTPDRVQNVVLPTDGFIVVMYQATWQESVTGAARASIFLGANQIKVAPASPAGHPSPIVQETGTGSFGSTAADAALCTFHAGLQSEGVDNANHYTGDVTTGQLVGLQGSGGPCYLFAAAGTYDVSIQFKVSSGTATVKNRKLWVWTAT